MSDPFKAPAGGGGRRAAFNQAVADSSNRAGRGRMMVSDDPRWAEFHRDLEREYKITHHSRARIRHVYTRRRAWHTVKAIVAMLEDRGHEHDEIAELAGVDRTLLYKWLDAGDKGVGPSFSAINLLLDRTGLLTAGLEMKSRDDRHLDALMAAINFTKHTFVKGSLIPEAITADWVKCLQFVQDRAAKRAGDARSDDDFAKIVMADAKGKLPELSGTPIAEINEFLNNWFHAYSLAIAVVAGLA